jgi:hypothetical protein
MKITSFLFILPAFVVAQLDSQVGSVEERMASLGKKGKD